MARTYTRIHRLMRILILIQSETGWNAPRLAEECGVAVRTIHRDLKELEGAGVPWHFDAETECYRIRKDFFMPPVELAMDEALAVAALCGSIGREEQIPFMAAAHRAAEKIRGRLPAAIRESVCEAADRTEVHLASAADEAGAKDVYERVREAIARRRALRCSYESIAYQRQRQAGCDDPPETFLFRPYSLYFGQRAWYAVGHHDGRQEIRSLRLSRFIDIELTDQPYAIPEDFTLETHFGQAWRMIRGDARYDVSIIFNQDFAETIESTRWHATQAIDPVGDDGSVRFTCQVDGLDEIVWWILSMGPNCHVESPPELREKVRALACATAALYEADADGDESTTSQAGRTSA